MLRPRWNAPVTVQGFTTTRRGGVSKAPFDSLNLGAAAGDEPSAVAENRRRMSTLLPSPPGWLRQVHGAHVARREDLAPGADSPAADAWVCATPGLPSVILTADCLPVLMCDTEGRVVAAAHAGWRGLVAGVLQATVAAMDSEPGHVLAWLGPGIGPAAYAVGADLQAAVLQRYPTAHEVFTGHAGGRYADLYALARIALHEAGVRAVSGGRHCTYTDRERFFSFRRDGRTGRMATAIWLENPGERHV